MSEHGEEKETNLGLDETNNDVEEDELEDTQPDAKSPKITFPFGFDHADCDTVLTTNTLRYSWGSDNTIVSMYFPSSFLKMVSQKFEESMSMKTTESSHYEIDATDLYEEILIKALSFYLPKYFKYFEDSDDFNGLLKVCAKYELSDLKIEIEIYLMDGGHDHITEKDLTLLQMADEFFLSELYTEVMKREVGFSFTECIGVGLLQMRDEVKYEIIKKCIMKKVDENKDKNMELLSLETVKILHFLDLWFYENKIFDYSLPSKHRVDLDQRHHKETHKDQKMPTSCRIKRNYDVIVKVEGVELYMNSAVLSDNSPVFKAMLKPNSFKEGQEKVIELPGKRVEDITDLFTALCRGRKLAEYDLFKLFPLCQEYQIDWLQDLMRDKLEDLNLDSNYMRLEYLNLLEGSSGFSKARERLINSLADSFIRLQLYTEFNTLGTKTKLLIALRQLWCNLVKLSHCSENIMYTTESTTRNDIYINQLGDIKYFQADTALLLSKQLGLLSIFKNIDDVSFCIGMDKCKLCTPLSTNEEETEEEEENTDEEEEYDSVFGKAIPILKYR